MVINIESIDLDNSRSYARKYLERSWTPIGYEHKSKSPNSKGWQNKKRDAINVDKEFVGTRSNVGLLLGEPSEALVDVDLDCPEAIALADRILPVTGAEFGRPSTPRAHRLYIANVEATVPFSASTGMVVELRSTGGQTMCPPSVHPSGERLAWESFEEPASVDGSDLHRRCRHLAFASLLLRAWKDGIRNKLGLATVGALLDHGWPDAGIERLLTIISEEAKDQPKDVVPPEKLIAQAHRRHAAKTKRTGLPTLARLLGEKQELLREWIDERPETERGVFASSDPILLARSFAKTLDLVWHWRGDFYQWTGCWWVLIDDEELKGLLYPWLEKVRVKERKEIVPVRATRTLVSDILSALAGVKQLPNTKEQPFWIDPTADDPKPSSLLPFRNGVLDLDAEQRQLVPSDHRLFALHGVECDYTPVFHGGRSREWQKFLASIFPGDLESQETVEEICGYLLSSDTSFQKAFAWIGDKRSGKGTIGRLVRAAVGTGRFINPTLKDFGETFGPANMIGKSVAMVSDTRGVVRPGSSVVETILTVTGEDAQSIRRMYKSHWNGVLPTRILLLSNGPLDLKDPTGVVISRLITVHFGESFYGREDYQLTEKLLAELPGIINAWLDGLYRLRKRGRFRQPQSAKDIVESMDESAGLVRAYVDQHCVVGPEWSIQKAAFRQDFNEWADDRGHHRMSEESITKQLLGLHRKIRLGRSRRSGDGSPVPMYFGLTTSHMAKLSSIPKGATAKQVRQIMEDGEEFTVEEG
jgi:P4 family phage/plasmid primase-like protien